MAIYDFQARQGATFDRSFTWKPGGTAADLAGFTARMQVRRTVRSTEPVVSLTHASGITLGGEAGTVSLLISASAMADIPARSYVYDIELIDGVGTVFPVLSGNFVVSVEVTR